MTTTEDVFFSAMEAISTIQKSAFRGSKDAAKQLSSLAFHATSSLGSLNADWTAGLSPDFAPLSARKLMVAEMMKHETHWPVMCRVKRDSGTLDLWRDLIEKGLVLFRMGDEQFDDLPIAEKSFMLTEYWMPILQGSELEQLRKLAAPRVLKSDMRKANRLKKKAKRLTLSGSYADDTKAVFLTQKSTTMQSAKKRRIPTLAEMREALETQFAARLKTMSPKNSG